MDYKKIKTETTTITRDIDEISGKTGNIYESVVVIAKRSNQIGVEIKEELDAKLEEFATNTDNLEEIFENREQIEIARYYEQLPKPTLIALHEFLQDQIYFRNPTAEEIEDESL